MRKNKQQRKQAKWVAEAEVSQPLNVERKVSTLLDIRNH